METADLARLANKELQDLLLSSLHQPSRTQTLRFVAEARIQLGDIKLRLERKQGTGVMAEIRALREQIRRRGKVRVSSQAVRSDPSKNQLLGLGKKQIQLEKLKQQSKSQEQQFKQLQGKADHLRSENIHLRDANAELQANRKKIEARVAAEQAIARNNESRLDGLQALMAKQAQAKKKLQQQNSELRATISRLERRVQDQTQQYSKLAAALHKNQTTNVQQDAIRSRLESLANEALNKEDRIRAQDSQIRRLHLLVLQHKQESLELKGRLQKAQSLAQELSKDLQRERSDSAALRADLKEHCSYQGAIRNQQKISQSHSRLLQAKIAQLNHQLQQRENAVTMLEANFYQANILLKQRSQQVSKLSCELEEGVERERRLLDSQQIMFRQRQQYQERLRQAVRGKQRYKQKYLNAKEGLESLLEEKGRLQKILSDDPELLSSSFYSTRT